MQNAIFLDAIMYEIHVFRVARKLKNIYRTQYNLNVFAGTKNSPREFSKKKCRTSAARSARGGLVVVRLRWF